MKLKIYSIIVTLALLALMGFVALMLLAELHRTAEQIATFKGFDGKPNQYQLWYANNGDLILRKPIGNPELLYRDYYGPLKVTEYKWANSTTLIIRLSDEPLLGTETLKIQIPLIEFQRHP